MIFSNNFDEKTGGRKSRDTVPLNVIGRYQGNLETLRHKSCKAATRYMRYPLYFLKQIRKF
jgi:hypothetical protein